MISLRAALGSSWLPFWVGVGLLVSNSELSNLGIVKVCSCYRVDGMEMDYLPAEMSLQSRIEPVYETFEGWSNSTRGARSWADLPATAIKYIVRIEELIGSPVAMLSTSPEREDIVLVKDPFAD